LKVEINISFGQENKSPSKRTDSSLKVLMSRDVCVLLAVPHGS